jgi:hypothetical protein
LFDFQRNSQGVTTIARSVRAEVMPLEFPALSTSLSTTRTRGLPQVFNAPTTGCAMPGFIGVFAQGAEIR